MEKNTPRLCFVVTKSNFGGAQRYVYDLATRAQTKGFPVIVLSGGKGELTTRLHTSSVKTKSIRNLSRDVRLISDVLALVQLVQEFIKIKPDVVHLNSPKAAGIGAVAARLVGVKKIVYTVHGWAFNEERSAFEKLSIKFFSWITIILAHHVVMISTQDKQTAPALFSRKKITLIKNGIDTFPLLPKEHARQKITEIPRVKDRLWVGVIAELHRNKGLDTLIDAAAEITDSNIAFFILGEGEEREHLEECIQRNHLSGSVFLTGHIPEARELLSAFDILAVPSVKEGLPYSILEAGVAKLPVLASNTGGIPDIITSGKSGLLVPPRNVHALTKALTTLIEDEKLRKQFGDALYEKVTADFSMQRMAEETFALYSL